MSLFPGRQPRHQDGKFARTGAAAAPQPVRAPKGFTAPVDSFADAHTGISEAYQRMLDQIMPDDNWSCPDCNTQDKSRRYPPPTTVKRCKSCQRFYNLTVNSRKERRDGSSPGLTFNRDEFLAWLDTQAMRCGICGITEMHLGDMDLKSSIGRKVVALGIDRMDNTKGYEFSNMQLCCYACNKAKGNVFTGPESHDFLGSQIAKAWIGRQLGTGKGPEADNRYDFQYATVNFPPVTCDKCGYVAVATKDMKCMACYKYNSIVKNSAKERSHEATPGMDMSAEEFGAWMSAQKPVCTYCGIDESALPDLGVKTSVGHTLRYLGVDRINNNIGYVPGNIALCCYACNKTKGNVFSGSEMADYIGPGVSRIWRDRVFSDFNPRFRPGNWFTSEQS